MAQSYWKEVIQLKLLSIQLTILQVSPYAISAIVLLLFTFTVALP